MLYTQIPFIRLPPDGGVGSVLSPSAGLFPCIQRITCNMPSFSKQLVLHSRFCSSWRTQNRDSNSACVPQLQYLLAVGCTDFQRSLYNICLHIHCVLVHTVLWHNLDILTFFKKIIWNLIIVVRSYIYENSSVERLKYMRDLLIAKSKVTPWTNLDSYD